MAQKRIHKRNPYIPTMASCGVQARTPNVRDTWEGVTCQRCLALKVES